MTTDDSATRLPKQMIQTIPGPFLLSASFVLASDKEDLADWDEPDTLWIEDPSYWLYVFCQDQTSQKTMVKLANEIFVDGHGRMHEVNLDKLWTAAKRTPADAATNKVLLQIGYTLVTGTVVPYVVWILASPFQLPRSRLPPLDDVGRTCRPSVFDKWANLRQLDPFDLPTEKYSGHALTVAVKPPWIEAFALNRKLVRALNTLDARLTDKALKERFLYETIRSLPNYSLHVNVKTYGDFYGEILHDELVCQQGLDEATIKLVGLVEGDKFVALLDDMVASEDPSAWQKTLVIWARSHHRLDEARKGQAHLATDPKKLEKPLQSKFSALLSPKAPRKVAKAYWSWVKMYVEAAGYERKLPQWVMDTCREYAQHHYGVTLQAPPLASRAQGVARAFTEDSVNQLKAKSTEHMRKTGFFAAVELLNLGVMVEDFRKHYGGTGGTKRLIALVGAASSVTSSLLDVAGATRAGRAAFRNHKQLLRVGKSFLGVVSSTADVYAGVENASEARGMGDKQAALFHGTTAVGGALGVVGYILLAGGATAPIGAVLVFLGGALGAYGGIGAAIFHDSDLDEWLKFCKWGKLAGAKDAGKSHGKDIVRAWAEGPLSTLSEDVDRQLRALSTLVQRLQLDIKFEFDGFGARRGIHVLVGMQCLSDKSVFYLEVTMNGAVVRPWSVWKTGPSSAQGRVEYDEHFPGSDCRSASARLRVDMFGDGKHWFPFTKDATAHAESTTVPEMFGPRYQEPT
jgi:hypothetical protein